MQAGINLVYVRDLLGHVDIVPTEIYVRADPELERKALEQAYPELISAEWPHWTKDDVLLTWLSRL